MNTSCAFFTVRVVYLSVGSASTPFSESSMRAWCRSLISFSSLRSFCLFLAMSLDVSSTIFLRTSISLTAFEYFDSNVTGNGLPVGAYWMTWYDPAFLMRNSALSSHSISDAYEPLKRINPKKPSLSGVAPFAGVNERSVIFWSDGISGSIYLRSIWGYERSISASTRSVNASLVSVSVRGGAPCVGRHLASLSLSAGEVSEFSCFQFGC